MDLEKPILPPREVLEPTDAELREFFPREIDFYGLGKLTLSRGSSEVSECAAAPFIAAFEISGDRTGLCAVAFDREPLSEDTHSMFLELANILVGKLISRLADHSNAEAMMSPPKAAKASEERLRLLRSALLAGGTQGSLSRQYEFKGKPAMTLRLAYLPGAAAERLGGRA